MNKTIIIILVILVIIGGFFFFFNRSSAPAPVPVTNENQPTPTVTNTTTQARQSTITYTDSGFSPATITIKKGDTVTFVNQSSRDMWVASNPHPIHTDYPAFDEKAAVAKGGSYSFTFDQVGTWGYHNHKNPSNTGTVVVE